MSTRARIRWFGACGVLVLAGALSAIFIDGLAGQLITIAFELLGWGGALLLIFFEVGLSEDREREREEEARRRRRRPRSEQTPQRRPLRWPRRPG
ncbi:MAG: hypothetical protein ACJ77M_07070 [Thermoleophilaceae bacterium]